MTDERRSNGLTRAATRSDRPTSRVTVGQILQQYEMSAPTTYWPPDLFAAALVVLEVSGAYTVAVDDWPPSDATVPTSRREQAHGWALRMRELGVRWRKASIAKEDPPAEIVEWWNQTVTAAAVLLSDVRDNRVLCAALLQLCAAADEACEGIGLPAHLGETLDEFNSEAFALLEARGTLASNIDPALARVLPKLHTPQVGMTTRSLSHHLAVVVAPDVQPRWHLVRAQDRKSLNLLVAPWPKTILPSQFSQATGPIRNMDEKFGFFTFQARHSDLVATHLGALFDTAKTLVGSIDGVVLPEMAVTEANYEQARVEIVDKRRAFLIAGTGRAAVGESFGDNTVRFGFPFVGERVVEIQPQHKHHRWRLDRSQLSQYGLESLTQDKTLWECIPIANRTLTFVALEPALTVCALICEDLARQDPVADLVRSVGPNLVVALLMDGPQLAARWSARYATVLADDPGCSVLTVTAAGMVDMCRGPKRFLESRYVALWKDQMSGGPYEINLPANADGLVLTLKINEMEEWTADGRSDERATGQLTLSAVYPVSLSRAN